MADIFSIVGKSALLLSLICFAVSAVIESRIYGAVIYTAASTIGLLVALSYLLEVLGIGPK